MIRDGVSPAMDAVHVLSFTFGLMIGYVVGRLRVRTDQAIQVAEEVKDEVEELRHKIEDDPDA